MFQAASCLSPVRKPTSLPLNMERDLDEDDEHHLRPAKGDVVSVPHLGVFALVTDKIGKRTYRIEYFSSLHSSEASVCVAHESQLERIVPPGELLLRLMKAGRLNASLMKSEHEARRKCHKLRGETAMLEAETKHLKHQLHKKQRHLEDMMDLTTSHYRSERLPELSMMTRFSEEEKLDRPLKPSSASSSSKSSKNIHEKGMTTTSSAKHRHRRSISFIAFEFEHFKAEDEDYDEGDETSVDLEDNLLSGGGSYDDDDSGDGENDRYFASV